jgi:hypothetical protein
MITIVWNRLLNFSIVLHNNFFARWYTLSCKNQSYVRNFSLTSKVQNYFKTKINTSQGTAFLVFKIYPLWCICIVHFRRNGWWKSENWVPSCLCWVGGGGEGADSGIQLVTLSPPPPPSPSPLEPLDSGDLCRRQIILWEQGEPDNRTTCAPTGTRPPPRPPPPPPPRMCAHCWKMWAKIKQLRTVNE